MRVFVNYNNCLCYAYGNAEVPDISNYVQSSGCKQAAVQCNNHNNVCNDDANATLIVNIVAIMIRIIAIAVLFIS